MIEPTQSDTATSARLMSFAFIDGLKRGASISTVARPAGRPCLYLDRSVFAIVGLTTLSTERLCNELEQWIASMSFVSFTTTSLLDPMLRTNFKPLHGPFPLPCSSSVQSAVERPVAGIADTLVRDRRRRGQLSRLYKRK